MSEFQTITVLYYDDEMLLELKSLVISNCAVGHGGRVIIPTEIKEGKLIIAVLQGEVTVLNTLGERAAKNNMVA